VNTRRKRKQILYGSVYASLLIIPLVVYAAMHRPVASCTDNELNQGETEIDCGGPCAACPFKDLREIETVWENFFPSGKERVVVGAKIKNPNIHISVQSFTYEFLLTGPSGPKGSLSGTSRILPGQTKYIVDGPIFARSEDIRSVTLSIRDIVWVKEDAMTAVGLISKSVQVKSIDNDTAVEVTGTIHNPGAMAIPRVRVGVIIPDFIGLPVLASHTTLNDLAPNDGRFFRLVIPADAGTIRNLNLSGVMVEPDPTF
jgi:hypothetical protein